MVSPALSVEPVIQPVVASRARFLKRNGGVPEPLIHPAETSWPCWYVKSFPNMSPSVPTEPGKLGWLPEQYVLAGGELEANVFVNSLSALPYPSS